MKKVVFFICIFLLSNIFLSAKTNVNFILKNLHKKYDNIKTFKSKFIQISYFKSANILQKYEGILYLKRPEMMRWDYTSPEVQSIISNGKKIWYYYPGDNQVNVGKLSTGKESYEMNLIFMILKGIKKIEDEFNCSLIEGKDNKNFYYLQLIPKKPGITIKKVILTISKKNFEIKQSHVFYINGDIIKLILKKSWINVKLNSSLFNFIPPAGVQIFEIPTMK